VLYEMVYDVPFNGAIDNGNVDFLEGMHKNEQFYYELSDKKDKEKIFSIKVCWA